MGELPAHAADIVTTIGTPGGPSWTAACGANAEVPTTFMPAGLLPCPAGFEDDCVHRVDIDNGASGYPQAVCNDGTPAKFYVREGRDADVDRWVIHLEGGAACDDEASCLERWCGQQGIYDASLMSTDWDGNGATEYLDHGIQPGLAFYSPDNDFSDWNHVYVPYCSSDGWLGTKTDLHPSNGSAFTIDARGHTILYAVRSMLRKLGGNPGWTAQGGYLMPDIDDASEILFTGTSAGGYGALQNADWFVAPFAARSGLVVDAGIDIADHALIDNEVWADTANGASINQYSHRIELELAKWATGGFYKRIDAFVDESCRAVYEPMGRLDRCSIPPALLILNAGVPFVSTPTFLRLDLEDNTLSDYYTDPTNTDGDSLLIGGASGSPITIDDYAVLARATLVELYDDDDAVEAVYGPRCGNHVGLDDLFALAVDTTEDSDTPSGASTLHDAILEWFDPGGSSQRIRWIDTDGSPSTSVCN